MLQPLHSPPGSFWEQGSWPLLIPHLDMPFHLPMNIKNIIRTKYDIRGKLLATVHVPLKSIEPSDL